MPTLQACLDEAGQADAICRAVLAARERGTPLKHQAVLFRAAHHSDVLEVELLRRNIPFVKFGGLKFLEAAHVKDALAMLRVLENPHDEVAWFRVLQLPEGMGPASARAVMDTIGVRREDGPTRWSTYLTIRSRSRRAAATAFKPSGAPSPGASTRRSPRPPPSSNASAPTSSR